MFSTALGRAVAKLTVAAPIWMFSMAVMYACDCSAPPVNAARARADVVFRGTIVALRPSRNRPDLGYGFDTQKDALFRVTRVWKGELGSTFVMPAIKETSACWGFWPEMLKVNNDLLVYAHRMPGGDDGTFIFVTSICSRTWLAKENKDFAELGIGHQPGIYADSKRRTIYLLSLIAVVVLSSALWFERRRSARPGL